MPLLLLFVAVVGCVSAGVDGNAPLFFSPSPLAAAVAAASTCPQHWCSLTLVVETAMAWRQCPSSLWQLGHPSPFWQWSRPTCYCPSLLRPASWSCPFCYLCLAAAVVAASTCPHCRCCLSTLLVLSALALTVTRSCFLSSSFLAVAVALRGQRHWRLQRWGGSQTKINQKRRRKNGGRDGNSKETMTTKARTMTAAMATAVIAAFLPDRQQSAKRGSRRTATATATAMAMATATVEQ